MLTSAILMFRGLGAISPIIGAGLMVLGAFGAGYVRGRVDAAGNAEIARLNAVIAAHEMADGLRQIGERVEANDVVRTEQVFRENARQNGEIYAAIQSAPIVGNCTSGVFLDRLRKLK